MKFIDRLERKFGRYGVPDLTKYIIICYVVGYFLQYFNAGIISYMRLEPAMILKGQIWRLVTWVICPPNFDSLLFFVIAIMFFYYPIGSALERTWGTFRYTLYIFSGVLFTIVGAFLLYLVMFILTGKSVAMGWIFTTYYISLSIFLAYAMSYPEARVLLWFVIPIKMKWMAYVYGIFILYDVVTYIRVGAWYMVIPIAASLLNYVLFYFGMKDLRYYSPKQVKRRQEFKRAMSQAQANQFNGVTKHKCAICGRTEQSHPDLEFRFCSRCNGNYEYCQDHLFTHEHIK